MAVSFFRGRSGSRSSGGVLRLGGELESAEALRLLYGLMQRGRGLARSELALARIERRFPAVHIERPFSVVSPERLDVGRNVIIHRNCHFHCGGFPGSQGEGRISIGHDCEISENNVLYGAGRITIGDNVVTGPGVMVFSSRQDYSVSYARRGHTPHLLGPVTIGSNVILYSAAVVTPGIAIGEGAVVGAGSIVLDDVPAWSVVAGAPARVIRDRTEDDASQRLRRVDPLRAM